MCRGLEAGEQEHHAEGENRNRRKQFEPPEHGRRRAVSRRPPAGAPSPLAPTARLASTATVIAVPRPIRNTAAMPAGRQALRQREDENDQRARAGPQADRRARPPAARASRRVRSAAVHDVRVIVLVRGLVMIVVMVVIVVMARAHDRGRDRAHRRRDAPGPRLWSRRWSCPKRKQLARDQPEPEQRHQRVGDDADPVGRIAHRRAGERERRRRDQRRRRRRPATAASPRRSSATMPRRSCRSLAST